MRRRNRFTEEQQRNLVVKQGDLMALANHPAWQTLQAVFEEKRQKVESHVLSTTLNGRNEIDTRNIEYWRGFLQGAAWLLAVPNGAEHRLEGLIKEKGVA